MYAEKKIANLFHSLISVQTTSLIDTLRKCFFALVKAVKKRKQNGADIISAKGCLFL